jgi:ABC-type uncharacterized transport system permease subunit
VASRFGLPFALAGVSAGILVTGVAPWAARPAAIVGVACVLLGAVITARARATLLLVGVALVAVAVGSARQAMATPPDARPSRSWPTATSMSSSGRSSTTRARAPIACR